MKVRKSPGGAVRRMRTSLVLVIYRPPQIVYARIRLTQVLRISTAKTGSNIFHQKRAVSWLMSIPRPCSRFSTVRSESGNRTYNHRKAITFQFVGRTRRLSCMHVGLPTNVDRNDEVLSIVSKHYTTKRPRGELGYHVPSPESIVPMETGPLMH